MGYDEALAARVGRALQRRKGITQKRMFGGVAFMLGERMFVGIATDELMVRVGPDRYARALARPGARPMDFTGRPMKGYVFVAAKGLRTPAALRGWIQMGIDFVSTLEGAKPGKKRPTARRSPRP